MSKPIEEEIQPQEYYRNRDGSLVQVEKLNKRHRQQTDDQYADIKILKFPEGASDYADHYQTNAWGGYHSDDDSNSSLDLVELVSTDEADFILTGKKSEKLLQDELDFAKADILRLQKQVDTANATISALNEQLVAANQRFYAKDDEYKKAEDEMDRLTTQIAVLYNKQKDTDEREKLLTFQREQQQNEIDAFQGILDKLQAMYNTTEADLLRERSHVDALMKLLDVAIGGLGKFMQQKAEPSDAKP